MIALALSGGGSRAIAFHLGCLRALHDRGVLDRVSVISSVSGGSVIAAMYAYLGAQDATLPYYLPDLVTRDQIFGYPTNFAVMSDQNISLLSQRGEQLTRMHLAYYCPEL